MTGHRPFSELTSTFAPERRARVAAKAACLREAMTLEELSKALALSQEDMAETLTSGPARRGEARKAHRHACEQSAPHRRSPRRHARNHGALPDASVVLTNIGEGPQGRAFGVSSIGEANATGAVRGPIPGARSSGRSARRCGRIAGEATEGEIQIRYSCAWRRRRRSLCLWNVGLH